MICNVCNGDNPADANYCINCGAALSYTGQTQRLETERLDTPLYVTRAQLDQLLHKAILYAGFSTALYNGVYRFRPKYTYYGREVIIIDD